MHIYIYTYVCMCMCTCTCCLYHNFDTYQIKSKQIFIAPLQQCTIYGHLYIHERLPIVVTCLDDTHNYVSSAVVAPQTCGRSRFANAGQDTRLGQVPSRKAEFPWMVITLLC